MPGWTRRALTTLAAASSLAGAVDRAGPAAHYVIRTSDLAVTLRFLDEVVGLKVIRHEENPSACPITCNGQFPTPWSKTMVGTDREDRAYALEVTYNYGVDSYTRGGGLQTFVMNVDNVEAAMQASISLGYTPERDALSGGLVVTGPDGYRYELQTSSSNSQKFISVTLASPDPAATAAWYVKTLGMVADAATSTIKFPGDAVSFTLVQADSVRVEQWDGRNAFSLPAAKVREVYEDLSKNEPDRIVHDLQEINEETGLGVLLIAIISDPNGLELCLVSSEAFEPAIAGAADWKGPDYKRRLELAAEYQAAAAAQSAKQAQAPFAA